MCIRYNLHKTCRIWRGKIVEKGICREGCIVSIKISGSPHETSVRLFPWAPVMGSIVCDSNEANADCAALWRPPIKTKETKVTQPTLSHSIKMIITISRRKIIRINIISPQSKHFVVGKSQLLQPETGAEARGEEGGIENKCK